MFYHKGITADCNNDSFIRGQTMHFMDLRYVVDKLIYIPIIKFHIHITIQYTFHT